MSVALVSMLCSCSDTLDGLRPNTPEGNFRALWEIIDTKYCYLDDSRLDWDGVYRHYEPQVKALKPGDYLGLFDLMKDMLDTLRDGHVNIYTPFDISSFSDRYDGYPTCFNSSLIFNSNYLGRDYRIAGSAYYHYLRDSVGYMRYPSMNNALSLSNLYYIFNYFRRARGLIIDLRSNTGGSLTNSELLASAFINQTTDVGYRRHKTGPGHNDFSQPQKMTLEPANVRWWRPAVLLVDRGVYSAANHCALCFKHAPQVKIIGCRTGGGGGLPLSYELPNGWLVRLSSVPMYDLEMNSIEDGIEPDITQPLDPAEVAAGKDNLIEAAIDDVLQRFNAAQQQ